MVGSVLQGYPCSRKPPPPLGVTGASHCSGGLGGEDAPEGWQSSPAIN